MGFFRVDTENLGFPEWWVALVMECVRSVKYRVQINHELTDTFIPERGLRQGDPLSPYLFLLNVEWLSKTLKYNMEINMLTGIQICRGAPPISHLFFC